MAKLQAHAEECQIDSVKPHMYRLSTWLSHMSSFQILKCDAHEFHCPMFIKYDVQVLQDFLNRSKESDILNYRIPEFDLQLEDIKDLVEDLSSNEGTQSSWR